MDERWWSDSKECYCHLADEKTPHERRFGEPFQGPMIPFEALVEYHPISTRDQMRLHQFERKYCLEIFPGYALIAVGFWEGDILIADLEELKNMEASAIYPRRTNAKETLIRPTGDEFILPVADATAKLSGRDYEFREPTPRREPTVRSADFSRELQGEPGESQPTESTDDAEARKDFWSIQGDFIYRHHNELRVQLYLPKEETFPF